MTEETNCWFLYKMSKPWKVTTDDGKGPKYFTFREPLSYEKEEPGNLEFIKKYDNLSLELFNKIYKGVAQYRGSEEELLQKIQIIIEENRST